MQPEDFITLHLLKNQFQAVKSALIIYQAITHKVGVIKGGNMLRLLKHPWDVAFCKEKVVAAWKITGNAPFTR